MAVGLAMVNFNGSDVLEITLDSMLRATVRTKFCVCLVDNGSSPQDYDAARKAFSRFQKKRGSDQRDSLIRSEVNLGFCGGSNLGIKKLLEMEDIDRVCLLNTDVIVTDYWLDRLMESDADIVGPVTNANGNEQTVFTDYSVKKNIEAFDAVQEFSAHRAMIYAGYEVPSSCVTGFCSLIKRGVFDKIGLLDERFYPGGFDDCDFDRRVRDAGGRIAIRRDCYLHHWGGGSFSKIEMNSRVGISLANMIRYEKKWDITWEGTQRLLPLSVLQDLEYLAIESIRDERAWNLVRKATNAISQILKNYERARIDTDLRSYSQNIEEQMQVQVPSQKEGEGAHTDRNSVGEKLIQTENIPYVPDPGIRKVATDLRVILQDAYHFVRAPGRRKTVTKDVLKFIEQGKQDKKGTIAILAPFYRPSKMKDGYFQRIYAVDQNVFADYNKVYFEQDKQRALSVERVDGEHIVVHFPPFNTEILNTLELLMKACGTVYSHSLLPFVSSSMNPNLLHWLTKDHIQLIVDIHGSVPEEAILCDDWKGAQIYQTTEEILMQGANVYVCVNHAMVEHFEKKYDYFKIKPKAVVMPIISNINVDPEVIEGKLVRTDYEKPCAVYVGGMQKWQNVDLMQDLMEETGDLYRYDMIVSRPDEFHRMYGNRKMPKEAIIHAVRPEEVIHEIRDCHFGILLRDDIAVNNVACPTKLIEYLSCGVLPVLKTSHIGDFERYGMNYIPLEDFRKGTIPGSEEYMRMIRENRALLSKFTEEFQNGRNELIQMTGGKSR